MKINKINENLTDYLYVEDKDRDTILGKYYGMPYRRFECEGNIKLLMIDQANVAIISFAPGQTEGWVIVKIAKNKNIENLEKAVAQYLSFYSVKNPFGLRNKITMKLDYFLRQLTSYMAVCGNTAKQISQTIKYIKSVSNKGGGTIESINGPHFQYTIANGKVTVGGTATDSFF